jgi:tRNA pseudouridine38-40 synthase
MEEAFSTVLRREVVLVGAGRTDAGVHACCMVAHFDVLEAIGEPALLVGKLNNMLPKDIAIQQIVPVINEAHARFDAVSRTYEYRVSEYKDPFGYEYVCRMSLRRMNFEQMNDACRLLIETSDFTSFSKLHTDVKTNVCRVNRAGWTPAKNTEKMPCGTAKAHIGDVWVFTICADRFLRNMVRAIVGTLFEVGRGKITVDDFWKIIEAKDRCKAGTSVPAEGLALTEIEYPQRLFL